MVTGSSKKNYLLTCFIFVGLLVFFLVNQYETFFTGYIRNFILFAHAALQHGLTFFPIKNHAPYPDYPMGGTFFVYLSSLLFGGKVSALSLQFPYAVSSALTLTFTYMIGALHDKKWGICAVLFGLFTWKFLDGTHFIDMDVYPALVTAFCFYLVYSAKHLQVQKRLWWIPAGLFLGFATRGPIGLVIPSAVILIYYLLEQDWKHFFLIGFAALITLLICFGLLMLGAYLQGGKSFLQDVMTMQIFERLSQDHAPRYYFYFTNGLLTYSPTVLFAITVIIKERNVIFKPENTAGKFLQILTAWFLIIIIGMTIPHTKKARYILALTPAISLLAAYIFIDFKNRLHAARKILVFISFLLPMIGMILAISGLIYSHFQTTVPLPCHFPLAIIGCFILFVLEWIIYQHYRYHPYYPLMIFTCGVLTLLLINLSLVYPFEIWQDLVTGKHPTVLSFWP